MKKKLRIAVLIDDEQISTWAYEMFSKIKKSSSGEIVLAIRTKPLKKTSQKYFVYNIYKKLDQKFFKNNLDALAKRSINDILLGQNLVNIDGLKDIKKYQLDILINIRPETLKENLLSAAKYGVWSFSFGNSNEHTFWEIIERENEFKVNLNMTFLKEEISIVTIATLPDNLSVTRSKNRCLWKAASILPQKVDELYRLGEQKFFKKVNEQKVTINSGTKKIRTFPSNAKAFFDLTKFEWRRFSKIFKNFFYLDQWTLLFNINETSSFSRDFSKYSKIIPPKDRFWADPHVIKKDGSYYIFIEELIYVENKGFISVIEMDAQGNYKAPVKVLEKEYHLSFPFLIEDNDQLYMIPESKQNNNIQLYKCIEFPFKWELEKILMDDVMAVDTVITKKDGKYFMFTNLVEYKGASLDDELYLFFSDSLISNNWQPFVSNPIVTDVKSARMAGKIFTVDNIIYRPSQNCSKHYGYALQINQIVELSESNYKEKNVESLYPDWDKNISSVHSLSSSGKLTVIDAQYKRRK